VHLAQGSQEVLGEELHVLAHTSLAAHIAPPQDRNKGLRGRCVVWEELLIEAAKRGTLCQVVCLRFVDVGSDEGLA